MTAKRGRRLPLFFWKDDMAYRVRLPSGVIWSLRFKAEDAAWSRIFTLKSYFASDESKQLLIKEGWSVYEET